MRARLLPVLCSVFCVALCLDAQAATLPWQQPVGTLNAQKATIDQAHRPAGPQIIGWLEMAYLPTISQRTRAKLDSGAKTSAINADIIKVFKRGKKEYVLFRIDLDKKIDATPVERQIVRWVKIKLKQGGLQKRPVIRLSFCIGRSMLDGEVSLAKRDHFNYNLLVGRNMLQSKFAIDASRTYTTSPSCR